MATKKPKKSPGGAKPKKSNAKWAKNATEAAKKAKQKAGKQAMNLEDAHVKGKRIRDLGQKPPKGYMRTGGRYFAKIENMRPIQSMTTQQQRNLFWSNIEKFLGADRKGGWVGSAGNQGMYNGDLSIANFRKTTGARKLMNDTKTFHQVHAGEKKAKVSRTSMAIGQDGHKR